MDHEQHFDNKTMIIRQSKIIIFRLEFYPLLNNFSSCFDRSATKMNYFIINIS